MVLTKLIEQRFGLFEIDRSEKFARRSPLAPIARQPRHAHRRAQLPRLCLPKPRVGDATA